jgi:hypothetical protein
MVIWSKSMKGPLAHHLLGVFCVVFLSACGGGGGSGSNLETPESLNSAPEFVGVMEYSVDENTTGVTTVEATDTDGDAITYSLSGSDANAFTVGATSGVLAFVEAPNYEVPTDSDADNIYEITVSASDGTASASQGFVITVADLAGSKMVLTGNSFFKPYAQGIGNFAVNAGFPDHTDTGVFSGGDTGVPKYLWSNPSEANQQNKLRIQAALDEGGVDVFGMTGSNIAESTTPTEGYSEWIAYALEENPDVDILISVPAIDFPADWQQRAEEFGVSDIHELYAFFVDDMMHKTLIDALREEFPSTHIFSIPTGKSATVLAQMHQDNSLSDDVLLRGPYDESLFTDEKGHQGKIIVETGTLMWLNGLYGVDLSSNDFDTGFETDLNSIAAEIMQQHDPNYSR